MSTNEEAKAVNEMSVISSPGLIIEGLLLLMEITSSIYQYVKLNDTAFFTLV